MSNTAEYIGYYVNDKGNTIYGVLFDPNVPQNLKNKVVDKNNVVIRTSNQSGKSFISNDRLRKFEKSDFESALFFPMAGVYDDYNNLMKVGTGAGYWTSTSFSSTQAKAFMPQVFNNGGTTEVFGGLTNTRLVKSNMYSIRPIYIGQ
jgi:putative lipoprotein